MGRVLEFHDPVGWVIVYSNVKIMRTKNKDPTEIIVRNKNGK